MCAPAQQQQQCARAPQRTAFIDSAVRPFQNPGPARKDRYLADTGGDVRKLTGLPWCFSFFSSLLGVADSVAQTPFGC